MKKQNATVSRQPASDQLAADRDDPRPSDQAVAPSTDRRSAPAFSRWSAWCFVVAWTVSSLWAGRMSDSGIGMPVHGLTAWVRQHASMARVADRLEKYWGWSNTLWASVRLWSGGGVARLPMEEADMSTPASLKEIYADEIKDLWSANEQMLKALTPLTEGVHDAKLKKHLTDAAGGIKKHNETLKELLTDAGEEPETEHCKGMEGLCREALKHGVKEAPEDRELRDIVIIGQYQRMCHYGITGFGSAAAIAKALAMKDQVTKLQGIVADIYGADELSSRMGEKLAKAAAKHAQPA